MMDDCGRVRNDISVLKMGAIGMSEFATSSECVKVDTF